jgi:hypothetical protein
MSAETIVPDAGFSREQKEYLQGYFTGLACGGMVPFVGRLPDGRLTNVAAPGLVNGAAETDAQEEETIFQIRRKRSAFVTMACFMSPRRRIRSCCAVGFQRVK